MDANLLAQIANPQLADPRAAFLGSQDANSLAKMRDQRNALALAPGAMAGDRNALAKLAGADPGLAMQIDERGYQRGRDAVSDRRASAGEGRAQAEFQRKQQADKVDQIASIVQNADTPAAFEQAKQFLARQGMDVSQLRFEDRQLYVDQAKGVSNHLKSGVGLNVIYGKDASGNIIPMQPSDSGEMVRSTVPDGVQVMGPYDKALDTNRGKNDADQPAKAAKAQNLLQSADQQWQAVTGQIDEALNQINSGTLPKTGWIGAITSNIAGTGAYDLSQVLDMIKANIGFDKLQEMRMNSPTGGALGQVSDFENKLLQAVRGSLQQGQSAPQLMAHLNDIKTLIGELQRDRHAAFQRDYGAAVPAQPPAAGGGWSVQQVQ